MAFPPSDRRFLRFGGLRLRALLLMGGCRLQAAHRPGRKTLFPVLALFREFSRIILACSIFPPGQEGHLLRNTDQFIKISDVFGRRKTKTRPLAIFVMSWIMLDKCKVVCEYGVLSCQEKILCKEPVHLSGTGLRDFRRGIGEYGRGFQEAHGI
jgi:hypothetical protein